MEKNFYTIFQRDGYYYYYVYDAFGRRHKRSTGIKIAEGKRGKERLQALLLRRSIEGTLLDPKQIVLVKFKDYATNFWNYKTCPFIQEKIARGGTFSEKMALDYDSQVRRILIPCLGDKLVQELTPRMIELFLLQIPKKYNLHFHTANTVLINLRHILDSAMREGLIESNPATQVKQLIATSNCKKAFTPEQIKVLFEKDWIGQELAYVGCYLSAATGMRLGEIRALTREQVHTNYIEVNASWANKGGRKTTKTGKPRIVPISAKVRYRLEKIMPNEGLVFTYNGVQPMCEYSFYRPLFQKLEEMGIDHKKEKLSFHSFRYYANTRLKAAGVPDAIVMATIGHDTTQMSEHYTDLSIEDMKQISIIQENSV